MKSSFWFLFVLSGITVLNFSCDKKGVFENYLKIDKEGWNKDSVSTFTFQILDTTGFHNIFINLRNHSTYNYSNIWLFIRLQSPDGKLLNDTVQFLLADPSGKWLGKGFGGIIDNQLPYMQNVYFPRSGTYRIDIQQGMRQVILRGISDIGLRIEKK